MTLMTLHELVGQYKELLALADSADPADQQMFADTLEGLQGELDEKILACARVHQSLTANADVVKAEEDRLAKRRKALENSALRLKTYMHDAMDAVGVKKVADDLVTVRIQANPPKVEIDVPAEELPKAYQRVTVDVDKSKIAADLKAGVDVPGCSLVRTESLRIV